MSVDCIVAINILRAIIISCTVGRAKLCTPLVAITQPVVMTAIGAAGMSAALILIRTTNHADGAANVWFQRVAMVTLMLYCQGNIRYYTLRDAGEIEGQGVVRSLKLFFEKLLVSLSGLTAQMATYTKDYKKNYPYLFSIKQ
jgi:hypothetical protein